MSRFDEIHARAAKNKGGEAALNALLPDVATPEAIAALDESRFLAEMSRCVFQAGFRFSVINNKWPGFEAVFHGFDVGTILGLTPEEWEEIGQDERIIRMQRNIRAVRANAQFIEDMALEHGGIGPLIAGWPENDLVGLLTLLKRRGSRLGGNTGQRFLRNIGKDTFILSCEVMQCLHSCGLEVGDQPASQRDLRRIQQQFDVWREETGLPYSHLSKIAACSIG